MSSGAPDVVVVGGGPAGLTASHGLREAGVAEVCLVEREEQVGGIPRHADHQGYGLRDLHRVMSGPRYARLLAERAADAGVDFLTSTQVTGWASDSGLEVSGPDGRRTLSPRAVVLATGCRERPRPARWVPGARPAGVLTTSTLQQAVYLNGEKFRGRALVVGAEHVSFSALQTLRHAGAEPVAMTTEQADHESYAAFRLGAAVVFRVPLLRRTRVERILGRRAVEAVELLDLDSGTVSRVLCDLVVFTGDWIPDHELAFLGGVGVDGGTNGPRIDLSSRTDRAGVFAVGNLLHGAETADVAALSGAAAVPGVVDYLAGGTWPSPTGVRFELESPLRWIVPGVVVAGDDRARRGEFRLRTESQFAVVALEISQGSRRLVRERLWQIGPQRSARIEARWTAAVDPDGGPLRARLLSARRRRRR